MKYRLLTLVVLFAVLLSTAVFAQPTTPPFPTPPQVQCAPDEDRIYVSEGSSGLLFSICFNPQNGKSTVQPFGASAGANRLHATFGELFLYNSYEGQLSRLFIGGGQPQSWGEYRLPTRGRIVKVEGNVLEMHFPTTNPRRVFLYDGGDYFVGRPERHVFTRNCVDSVENGGGYWCLIENGSLIVHPLTFAGYSPNAVLVAEGVTGIAAGSGDKVVYTTQTQWECPPPSVGSAGRCQIKAFGQIMSAEYAFQGRRANLTRIAMALTNGDLNRSVLSIRGNKLYFVSDDPTTGSQLLMLDLGTNRQWLVFGRRELSEVTRAQHDSAWIPGFTLAPAFPSFPPPPPLPQLPQ